MGKVIDARSVFQEKIDKARAQNRHKSLMRFLRKADALFDRADELFEKSKCLLGEALDTKKKML